MEYDIYKNSVIFVTAFKDLNRGEWGHGFTRSVDTYLSWFKNLTKLPIRLICYCEKEVEERIHSELGFFNTYPYEPENTFLIHVDKEREIMESPAFKNIVNHRNDPETNQPSYNLVNHNKYCFVKRTKDTFPGYSYYAWIDFGYLRNENELYSSFKFDTINSELLFSTMDNNIQYEFIKTQKELCIRPQTAILGGLFFVKKESVDWLIEQYTAVLYEYYSLNLVDDDQALILQLYKKFPEKFTLRFVSGWFEFIKEFVIPLSIDVVIPTCEKDLNTLNIVIQGVKKNIENLGRIYVVCDKSLSQYISDAIFIDEESYPFSKRDIITHIFDTNSSKGRGGPGWFLQQLLKLYSFNTISGISSNILIVDSETIFYKKYTPIQNNVVSYAVSNEVTYTYRSHMTSLLPYMKIYSDKISGICHQMLFQRHVLQNLFDRVYQIYKLPFWKSCILITRVSKDVYSEYDLYFNFILHFHRTTTRITNDISWDLSSSIPENSDYTYLTAHSHLRGNSNLAKNTYYVSVS